ERGDHAEVQAVRPTRVGGAPVDVVVLDADGVFQVRPETGDGPGRYHDSLRPSRGAGGVDVHDRGVAAQLGRREAGLVGGEQLGERQIRCGGGVRAGDDDAPRRGGRDVAAGRQLRALRLVADHDLGAGTTQPEGDRRG